MSTTKIFSTAVILFWAASLSCLGQDITEKRTERSSCFSGKITLNIQHCTSGRKNGAISLDIPNSAGNTTVYWVGFEVGKEAKKIDKIGPGYYTIVIFDGNNCSTKIEKVLVKQAN
jgi:hypothetical protein